MAKGLLFVAFTACLLASAHPFIIGSDLLAPVTGVVNGLANSVGVMANAGVNVTAGLTGSLGALTGVVQGATGTVTNLTGSLTSSVNSLVKPALQIVNVLPGTVGGLTTALNVEGLAGTVGKTLQTAVAVPLNVVSGLSASISGSLNPAKLIADITGALKPTLDALTSVTKQLTGTGAAGCLLNSATGVIKGSVLTSVGEILTCATPVTNVVKDLTKDVTNITTNNILFANQVLLKATKCIQQSATSANIGGIVTCIVDPVTQSATIVTNALSDATPLVSNTLSSAMKVPACVTNVLTKSLNQTTEALQSIVKCALGKGVNVTLPTLPNVVPNFTSIANTAIFDLEDVLKSALGPNSPINKLFATVNTLKEVTTTLIPNAVNSVNTTLNSIQAVINTALKSANGNPAALVCVSTAQKSLNDLAPPAIKTVIDCATNVGNKTGSLVAQAVAIDISLKTEIISVASKAFAKCTTFTASSDDSAEKCFKSSITEVKAYIKSQFDKINAAITTAQSLIDASQKCLSSGVSNANKASNLIVDQINACLAGQGATTTPEDITSVVTSGKAAVEKLAADLIVQVNFVSTISVTVQGSLDFIVNIDRATIEGVINGSASAAINAVTEVESALKDNTNPAVKACIASAKDKVGKLEATAVTVAADCVNSIKQKATSLAAQFNAEDKLLKDKLANAGVNAQTQCSVSSTKAIAEKCFVDAQVNLNADTVQAIDRVQTISGNIQMAVNDAISCVNESTSKVAKSGNEALDTFSKCLAAQGIKVTFSVS